MDPQVMLSILGELQMIRIALEKIAGSNSVGVSMRSQEVPPVEAHEDIPSEVRKDLPAISGKDRSILVVGMDEVTRMRFVEAIGDEYGPIAHANEHSDLGSCIRNYISSSHWTSLDAYIKDQVEQMGIVRLVVSLPISRERAYTCRPSFNNIISIQESSHDSEYIEWSDNSGSGKWKKWWWK